MKSALITLIALVSSVTVMAGTIELTTYAKVYEDQSGYLEELVTFLPGTRLIVEDRSYRESRGERLHRVVKVKRPNSFPNSYRVEKAYDINNNSDYVNFFISESNYRRGIDLRNDRPVVQPVRPIREVRRPAPIRETRQTRYDRDSYVRCYERPSRMVTVVNERKRERGNNRVGGGLFVGVLGQVIGAATDDRRLGNAISGVGAVVAIAGVIDLSTAKQEVFEGGYNECRRYYTQGRTVNDRRNRGCTVTRYYSSSWEGTTEYFERKCGRNQGSYHFNRREVSWN